MTTRTKIILSITLLLVAFASGRFMAPEKTKEVVKTVEVEKVVTQVVHQKVYIKENPDGSKETTIVTDTNTDSKTNSVSTDASKETSSTKSHLNVSVLAGSSFPLSQSSVIYGASVTKNLLGPITISAWGLSNLTGGIGLGLNF